MTDKELPNGHERNDMEIAHAALAALKSSTVVPHERLTVAVTSGRLTLAGVCRSSITACSRGFSPEPTS